MEARTTYLVDYFKETLTFGKYDEWVEELMNDPRLLSTAETFCNLGLVFDRDLYSFEILLKQFKAHENQFNKKLRPTSGESRSYYEAQLSSAKKMVTHAENLAKRYPLRGRSYVVNAYLLCIESCEGLKRVMDAEPYWVAWLDQMQKLMPDYQKLPWGAESPFDFLKAHRKCAERYRDFLKRKSGTEKQQVAVHSLLETLKAAAEEAPLSVSSMMPASKLSLEEKAEEPSEEKLRTVFKEELNRHLELTGKKKEEALIEKAVNQLWEFRKCLWKETPPLTTTAAAYAAEISKHFPEWDTFLLYRAMARFELEKYEGAQSDCEQLIKNNNNMAAYCLLGIIYCKQKNDELAKKFFYEGMEKTCEKERTDDPGLKNFSPNEDPCLSNKMNAWIVESLIAIEERETPAIKDRKKDKYERVMKAQKNFLEKNYSLAKVCLSEAMQLEMMGCQVDLSKQSVFFHPQLLIDRAMIRLFLKEDFQAVKRDLIMAERMGWIQFETYGDIFCVGQALWLLLRVHLFEGDVSLAEKCKDQLLALLDQWQERVQKNNYSKCTSITTLLKEPIESKHIHAALKEVPSVFSGYFFQRLPREEFDSLKRCIQCLYDYEVEAWF